MATQRSVIIARQAPKVKIMGYLSLGIHGFPASFFYLLSPIWITANVYRVSIPTRCGLLTLLFAIHINNIRPSGSFRFMIGDNM
jgi:hypothetical protein